MLQPRQCFKVLLSQIVTVKLLFLRVFMYLVLKACLQKSRVTQHCFNRPGYRTTTTTTATTVQSVQLLLLLW